MAASEIDVVDRKRQRSHARRCWSTDQPLASAVDRLGTWSFGPDEKGDESVTLLAIPAGTTGASFAGELVRILREGQARLTGEYKHKLSRRRLEQAPDFLERALERRAELIPEVAQRLALYEGVLAQLGSAEAPSAPRGDEAPVAFVPLTWLQQHLDQIAGDVFDAPIRVTRVVAQGTTVRAEFVAAGESETHAEIEWPAPQLTDERKLLELIDAIRENC